MFVYTPYCGAMSTTTTTVRVSRPTHDLLKDLAELRGESLTSALDRSVRLLQQETIAADLADPLREDEAEWLDAEAG